MEAQRYQIKESAYLLTQSFAYLFAGLFFLVLDVTGCLFCWLQVIGYAFCIVSLILLASLVFKCLTKLAQKIDDVLYGSLVIASLALLTKTIADLVTVFAGQGEFAIPPFIALVWLCFFTGIGVYRAVKRRRASRR